MLLLGFPSTVFSTNCYVVAPAAGEECVIVDPGIEIEQQLADVLREHRLRPAAVLLTHGHIDHVYSVTPVCGGYGVAARIHPDDRYRLVDPLGDLDPGLVAMLEQQFGRAATWQEPSDVDRDRRHRQTPDRWAGHRRPARTRPHRGLGALRPARPAGRYAGW